jgi:chromosome segregation ATPase
MLLDIMANPTDSIEQALIDLGVAVEPSTSLDDILINSLLEQKLIGEVINGLPETKYSLVAGNHTSPLHNYDAFNAILSKLEPSAIIQNEKGFRYVLLRKENGQYEFGKINPRFKETFEEKLNNFLQASNHSDERLSGLDPDASLDDSIMLDAAFSEDLRAELPQEQLQGEPTMTDDRKYEIDFAANLPSQLTPMTFGPNVEAMVSLPGQEGFTQMPYHKIPPGTDFQIQKLPGYFRLTDNDTTITLTRPKQIDTQDYIEELDLDDLLTDTPQPVPPTPQEALEPTSQQKTIEELAAQVQALDIKIKATEGSVNGMFEEQGQLEENQEALEARLNSMNPRKALEEIATKLNQLQTKYDALESRQGTSTPDSLLKEQVRKLSTEVTTLRSMVDSANTQMVNVYTQFEEGGTSSNVDKYTKINPANIQPIPSLADAPRNSFVEVINPLNREKTVYRIRHDGTQEELTPEKIEELIEKETKEESKQITKQARNGFISKGTHYARLAATTATLVGLLGATIFGGIQLHESSKKQGAKEQVEKFVDSPMPREIITKDGIITVIEVNGQLKYDLDGDGIFTNASPHFEIDAQGTNVALNNNEARLEKVIAGYQNLDEANSQLNDAQGQQEDYQAKLESRSAKAKKELTKDQVAANKLDGQLTSLQTQRENLALGQSAQKELLEDLETAISTQRKELAKNKKDLGKAKGELAANKKTYARVRAQIPTTTQKARDLHKEAGALERRVTKADTRVQESQTKLASLEKKYQAGNEKRIAFAGQVADSQKELDTMQGSIRSKNKEVTRLTAQSKANTTKVSEMYQEAKPLLEDLEARTTDLTPKSEEILATAKKAQTNINAANATYNKIKTPVAQLTPQAAQAREDTSQALDQLVQAQTNLKTTNRTYDQIKGPIAKLSTKAAKAKADASKAKADINSAQATYKVTQGPISSIAPLAAQARVDSTQALEAVTLATTNYNKALTDYKATQAKVDSLNTNTDELSQTITALETSYNRLNQVYQRTLGLKTQTTNQFPDGLESYLKTTRTQLKEAKELQAQLIASQEEQYDIVDLEVGVEQHISTLDPSKFKKFKGKELFKLDKAGKIYAAKKQGETYLIVRATSCDEATQVLEPLLATITDEDISKIVNDDCVDRYNGQTKKSFNFF